MQRTRTIKRPWTAGILTAGVAAAVIWIVFGQPPGPLAPLSRDAETVALRVGRPSEDIEAIQAESVSQDRAEVVTQATGSRPEEPPGVLPDEMASEALLVLRQYKIPAPSRLPTQEDWNRLTTMVLAMAAEIRAARTSIQDVGSGIAKERRASGRFDTYPSDPQPSTKVPGYAKKWPWMAPQPGEWQHYHSYQGKIEVVRVLPGEDPRMDTAQGRKRDLIVILGAEVEQLSHSIR